MTPPKKARRGRPRHTAGSALRGTRRLERPSEVPLHYQLGEILKEWLEAGHFEPDSLFPSERELEERFSVSRSVVRPALGLLVADGEIRRVRGSGTYVSPPKRQVPICGLLAALFDPPVPDLELAVIGVAEHDEDAKIGKLLGLDRRSSKLLQVTAVLGRGEPLCLVDSYVALRDFPWLPEVAEALGVGAERPSHPKVGLGRASFSVEASFLGPWTSSLLGAPVGGAAFVAALLQHGTPARARRSRPVEFARMIYRGDRVRLASDP